jgi:hypothetical protein
MTMTSAGTALSISAGAPVTFNEEGFEALAFTEIGEVTDIGGDLGRAYNLVTHNPIAVRRTRKYKGAFNSGAATITLALDNDDAGQVLVEAALLSDSAYSFQITRQDGSIRFFRAMVMSFPESYGNVDTITTRTVTLEITTDDAGNDFIEIVPYNGFFSLSGDASDGDDFILLSGDAQSGSDALQLSGNI